MNIMYRISMVLLWCMLSLGVYAQSSHWRCEDRAFQYDMTAYVSLTDNDGNRWNRARCSILSLSRR